MENFITAANSSRDEQSVPNICDAKIINVRRALADFGSGF